jgi:hypothetical protein
MPARVSTPERRISSTTTFVVALAFARRTVLAALALAAVSARPAVPGLVPRALAAASAARVRSLIRRASSSVIATTVASTAARQDWTGALSLGRSRTRTGTGILAALRYGARPMKASSAHRLLPFRTFGEAAAFDLEVEVSCQCRRHVVIDGMAPAFLDRRIMGTRFRCTTMRKDCCA